MSTMSDSKSGVAVAGSEQYAKWFKKGVAWAKKNADSTELEGLVRYWGRCDPIRNPWEHQFLDTGVGVWCELRPIHGIAFGMLEEGYDDPFDYVLDQYEHEITDKSNEEEVEEAYGMLVTDELNPLLRGIFGKRFNAESVNHDPEQIAMLRGFFEGAILQALEDDFAYHKNEEKKPGKCSKQLKRALMELEDDLKQIVAKIQENGFELPPS